jgi:peptidoglycan/LPS O-acetylase OafA/YrhL
MTATPIRGEIKALTGLRWLAATLVFCFHFRPDPLDPPRTWGGLLAGVGWAGVTIFFALSGFLLTMLYFEQFRRGLAAAEVKSYLLKRVARIYPLYFALLGFTVLLWSLGVDTGVRDPSIVGSHGTAVAHRRNTTRPSNSWIPFPTSLPRVHWAPSQPSFSVRNRV